MMIQFYTNNSQNLGRITFSFSGAEINTTNSGDTMPVLTCTGNTDGLWSYGVASLYPNLSAGNNVYCPIGVKYSSNDCIGMGFHYTADGSNSNYCFIEALGSGSIARFFADMHSEFAGYIQSPYYTSDNTCYINASNNHELTIGTNDGQIWFNYANRLNMGVGATDYYFGTDGDSSTQTLANVHAKTFTGDLSGTAEKAVCDTNGASITSTYVAKSSLTSVPTENSTNPITSGGVYTAIKNGTKIYHVRQEAVARIYDSYLMSQFDDLVIDCQELSIKADKIQLLSADIYNSSSYDYANLMYKSSNFSFTHHTAGGENPEDYLQGSLFCKQLVAQTYYVDISFLVED